MLSKHNIKAQWQRRKPLGHRIASYSSFLASLIPEFLNYLMEGGGAEREREREPQNVSNQPGESLKAWSR
jgi:hypothetical protein